MYQFILMIHLVTVVCLIILVLVQQGKGAAMGAAFGSGASQTLFGSRGSGSFLLKITIGFALLFFATSIGLNYLASKMSKAGSEQGRAITLPLTAPHPSLPSLPLPNRIPLSS